MKAIFVSGREYRRVVHLLELERTAATVWDRQIKSLQETLSGVRGELEASQDLASNEVKAHARTADTCQRRTNDLSQEKQAHHETRKELARVVEELRQANLRLDLGRDRREVLRQSNILRGEAMHGAMHWLQENSVEGSDAWHVADVLQQALGDENNS